MSKEVQNNKPQNIVLYQIDNTNICVSVYYQGETFWLSQKAMAELFGCSTDNISLHLKNIFSEGELDKDSVTEKYSATAADLFFSTSRTHSNPNSTYIEPNK